MVDARTLRRALLVSLIGALAIAALTGIAMFILGDFGETEIKILVTTLSLAFFSVTSLACSTVLETKGGIRLAVPGLGVSLLGLAWSLAVIWPEWNSEPMMKTMVILVLFAFSLAQACLLALPRLKASLQWLFPAALACIFSLATLISLMLVFEWDDELLFRLVGVLGILDASATLAIPALYKLTGKAPLEAARPAGVVEGGDWRIELCCPRCGQAGVYPMGTIECPQCSLRVRVAVVEPVAAQEAGRGRSGRFQFSLKAVLLAFLVASLPLGWVGYRIEQLRRQAAVIKALTPMNPQVHYNFGNAIHISFTAPDSSRFDASLFARLKELPKLRTLQLNDVPITDEDVVYLEGLNLQWMQMEGTTRLSAAAVERLTKAHPDWSISVVTSDSLPEEEPAEYSESPEYAVGEEE